MLDCSKYSAGMLKDIVEIQEATRASDGKGGIIKSWSALSGAPTRGMMRAVSGGERFASARTEATTTHRLVVRYFDGLQNGHRVMFRSKAFNITFINNVDYADKWLEISLQGGVAT